MKLMNSVQSYITDKKKIKIKVEFLEAKKIT